MGERELCKRERERGQREKGERERKVVYLCDAEVWAREQERKRAREKGRKRARE